MAEGFPKLKRAPFERNHLLEDESNPNRKRDIFSVSLNPEQRAMVDKFRQLWACDNDSTVLKELAECGAKVLLGHFGEQTLSWLASPRRTRATPASAKGEQNVTPNPPLT